MKESDLFLQLEKFIPFRYASDDIRFPDYIQGIATPVSPPYNTDCVAFLEGLLVPVACRADPYLLWGRDRHRQFMIRTPDRFGNITAVCEAQLAEPISEPAPWTLCQGWRRNGTGHAFMVVRPDLTSGKVLILEASKWLSGVGWRGVGTIRVKGCTIPSDWQDRAPTWDRVKEDFKELKMAQLLVELTDE